MVVAFHIYTLDLISCGDLLSTPHFVQSLSVCVSIDYDDALCGRFVHYHTGDINMLVVSVAKFHLFLCLVSVRLERPETFATTIIG